MKNLIILATLLLLTTCDQLIPIQKGGYGFTVGDPNGKLQIEAFFDFQCIHHLIKVATPKILIQFFAA